MLFARFITETNERILVKHGTSGSHGVEYKDNRLLECCAVYSCRNWPTIHSFLLPPSSGRRGLKRPSTSTGLHRAIYHKISVMDTCVQCLYSTGLDWNHLALNRVRRRAVVNTIKNFRVPINSGNFFTSWVTIRFSRRTLLHGGSNRFLKLYSCCKMWLYGGSDG